MPALVKSLSTRLKKSANPPKREPLWKGPESTDPNGGITQGMIGTWLTCRERARITLIEGLQPADKFNHYLEFGNLWHTCEEHHALGDDWQAPLLADAKGLCQRYPLSQEQINHWYNVCKATFPIYADYWSKHPDIKKRVPLLQEEVFRAPYLLPSGRIVQLRGKWDSVDKVDGGIYLQENKTKSDIDEEQIKRQVSFDLQTMLYLIALQEYQKTVKTKCPIKGIRYNVVKRPLSGGKGSIRKHQATKNKPEETDAEFYQRLADLIQEDCKDSNSTFFMRWDIGITQSDIDKFKKECLDPILENICWWYDKIVDPYCPTMTKEKHPPTHWRTPYGWYSSIADGRVSDLDNYLLDGNPVGLERVDTLFKELK